MATTVAAPMVGRIVRIEKHAGDAVDEDEAIMIMEAIKMEIPVVASMDGIVKSVKVAEGETVTVGQALAEIE